MKRDTHQKLEEELRQRLERLHVRVDISDDHTLFLRNVPSMGGCFNKHHTNLLIKRAGEGMPLLVCVDEDLEYRGSDRALARAFTAARKQQGWKVIFVEHGPRADFKRAVERALDCLGFDGKEPVLSLGKFPEPSSSDATLIASFGKNLSEMCGADIEPTIGRRSEVREVVTAILEWQPKLAIIMGNSGAGKTNLLYAVARYLRERVPELQLASVDLASLFAGTMFDAERENLFSTLLNEAAGSSDRVVALEHIEMALLGQVPRADIHLSNALDRGTKLIGTTAHPLTLTAGPILERRARIVNLSEMDRKETEKALLVLCPQIESHHGIHVDEELIQPIVEIAQSLEGFLPAKAIALLDAAAGGASSCDETKIGLSDIHRAAARFREDGAYPTIIGDEG